MLLQYDRKHIDRDSVFCCVTIEKSIRHCFKFNNNISVTMDTGCNFRSFSACSIYESDTSKNRCLSLTYRLVYNWERNKFACYCSLASEWVWNLHIMLLTIVVSTLRLSTTKNESNWTESNIFVNHLSTPFFWENWAISILASKRRC